MVEARSRFKNLHEEEWGNLIDPTKTTHSQAPVEQSHTHHIIGRVGLPVLIGFSRMQLSDENTHWATPGVYRAPEVILQLPWGCPVDIWTVGLMVKAKPQNWGICTH